MNIFGDKKTKWGTAMLADDKIYGILFHGLARLYIHSHMQGLAALMAEIRGEVILSPPGFHLEARRRGMI